MEEPRVLAQRVLANGLSEEAPVAMRDALGMARMREGSRQRSLAALNEARLAAMPCAPVAALGCSSS